MVYKVKRRSLRLPSHQRFCLYSVGSLRPLRSRELFLAMFFRSCTTAKGSLKHFYLFGIVTSVKTIKVEKVSRALHCKTLTPYLDYRKKATGFKGTINTLPSCKDPENAAWPWGNTVLTKMPIDPRGESVPPTILKPKERWPGPFSKTTVRIWKLTSRLWRGKVQKLGCWKKMWRNNCIWAKMFKILLFLIIKSSFF